MHRASHAQAALQRPVVAGPPSSMVESPGARSFTKAGVEPASSASAATASRMGTGRGLTRPCSSSAMNNAEVTAAASAASPFPRRFQTWTTPLQDFFRRITATTTCDVCSHAPTTPPHWSTLRRSASSLSSIDHNHGSILRATSPYPRATGLEQKTQRESWRRHTSHGVACCDNLASGPEGSMGQYIWGSRHCCPENWTLQSFRLE